MHTWEFCKFIDVYNVSVYFLNCVKTKAPYAYTYFISTNIYQVKKLKDGKIDSVATIAAVNQKSL